MPDRHPQAWPDARPTRFEGLGYMMLAPGVWRIVDLVQTKYNGECTPAHLQDMNNPSCTGPSYLTKAELLADLDRFATDYGAPVKTAPTIFTPPRKRGKPQ